MPVTAHSIGLYNRILDTTLFLCIINNGALFFITMFGFFTEKDLEIDLSKKVKLESDLMLIHKNQPYCILVIILMLIVKQVFNAFVGKIP